MSDHTPIGQKRHPVIPVAGVHAGDIYIPDVDSDGQMRVIPRLWNASTLSYEDATGSTGSGTEVEVTNFPAVISGLTIPITNALDDPLAKYEIGPWDLSGNPMYFGFIALDGKWYIIQLNVGSGALYFNGVSDFATNWTNRASLTPYVYPDGLTWT